MTQITDTLQEIKSIAEKATPGPWGNNLNGMVLPITDDGEWDGGVVKAVMGDFSFDEESEATEQANNDLDFIAASRDLIPRLVAALEHEMETSEWLRTHQGHTLTEIYEHVDQRHSTLLYILTKGDK